MILHHNTKSWMDTWAGPQLTLRLDAGLSEEATQKLDKALTRVDAVVEVRRVTLAEATSRLGEYVGQDRELLALLKEEVRPAIEVKLESGLENVAVLHPFIERLEQTPGIVDVDVQEGWSSSVRSLIESLHSWIRLLVAILFITATIAVTLGVRLACVESGQEVSLWRMLGARDGGLLASSHGAVLGGVGAFLGLVSLWAFFTFAMAPVLGRALGYVGDLSVSFMPWTSSLLFVFAGAALGAIGGWWAVEKNQYVG